MILCLTENLIQFIMENKLTGPGNTSAITDTSIPVNVAGHDRI